MKIKKRFSVIFLILLLVTVLSIFVACDRKTGISPIVKIVVTTLPKTDYYLGDSFDVGNAELTVTYEDGTTKVVPLDNTMISGFDSNRIGEQVLTIKYNEVSEYISVNVTTGPIYSIEIDSLTHKTEYVVGEDFSVKDLTMLVTYSNGRTEVIPVTEDMVSGFSSNAPGENQLVISYGNCICNLSVNVVSKSIMQMQLKAPSKLSYIVGDIIDFTGGTLYISYNDNSNEYLSLKELYDCGQISVIVSNELSTVLTKSQIGCTVTIYYEGRSFPYAINVEEMKATSVAVTTDITDQIMGSEGFNFSNGIITVTYNNKQVVEIPFDDERVSLDLTGCDINSTGTYRMVISVGGITFDHNINVVSPSPQTLVVTPIKTKIYQGEEININKWQYSIILNNGKKQLIGGKTENYVTDKMLIGNISDFDNFKVGSHTFNFSLTATNSAELSCQTDIEVMPKLIVDMEIFNNGKTVYSEGDSFALTDTTLSIIYNNGDIISGISVTEGMLFDKGGNALDTTELLSDSGATGKSEKQIFVKYVDNIFDTDFTSVYTVLLVKKAISIELIGTPAPRAHYVLGEKFDNTDWQIMLTYSNETTTTVIGKDGALNSDEWRFEFIYEKNSDEEAVSLDFDKIGEYEISLYYGGGTDVKLTYFCTVSNDVISIASNTAHIGFVTEGTYPSFVGKQLTVTRENGDKENVSLNSEMIKGFIAPNYKSNDNNYISAFIDANSVASLDFLNGEWGCKYADYYIKNSQGEYISATNEYSVLADYKINLAKKYSFDWDKYKHFFYIDANGTEVETEYSDEIEYFINNTISLSIAYSGKNIAVPITVISKTIVGISTENYKADYVVDENDWSLSDYEFVVYYDNGTSATLSGIESTNGTLICSDENGLFYISNGLRYNLEIGIVNENNFTEFSFSEFKNEFINKLTIGADRFHSKTLFMAVKDAFNGNIILSESFEVYCFEELIEEIKLFAGEYDGITFTPYEKQSIYLNEGRNLIDDGFVYDDLNNKQSICNNLYLYVRGESGNVEYYSLLEAKSESTSFSISDYSVGALQQSIEVVFLRKKCTIAMEIRPNIISSLSVRINNESEYLSVIENMSINPDDLIIEVMYIDADGNQVEGLKIVNFEQATCDGYSQNDIWEFGNDDYKDVTIKVGYGNYPEKCSLDLRVNRKKLVDIYLTTMPKLEYVENPTNDPDKQTKIDYTGGKVSLCFDNGTTQVLALSDGNLSKNINGFNPNKELTGGSQEQQTIYISYTYQGITKQTSYNIIVVDRKYVTIKYDDILGYDKKLICEYGSGEAIMPLPEVKYFESFRANIASTLERGDEKTKGEYLLQYRNSQGELSTYWPTEVGIYTIKISYFEDTGDENNNGFSDESVTLEIKKKELGIVIEDFEFTFGDRLNGDNDTALVNIKNSLNKLKWKMTAVVNGIADGTAYCYGDNDSSVIESIKLLVYPTSNSSTNITFLQMDGSFGARLVINAPVGEYIVKPIIVLKEGTNYYLSNIINDVESQMTVKAKKIVISAESANKVYGSSEPEYLYRIYNYEDVQNAFGQDTDISSLNGNQVIEKESSGLLPIGNKNGIFYPYDTMGYNGGVFDLSSEIIFQDKATLEYHLTRSSDDTDNVDEIHPIYSGASVNLSNYEIVYVANALTVEKANLILSGENAEKYFGTSELLYSDKKDIMMHLGVSENTPIFGGDSFEELFYNYFDDYGKIFYYNRVTHTYHSEIIGDGDDYSILYKGVKIYKDLNCTMLAGTYSKRDFTISAVSYSGYYCELPIDATVGTYYIVIESENATLRNYNIISDTASGNYAFSITIKKSNVSINAKSFVVTGSSSIKDQQNGANGRLLTSYFTDDDLIIDIVDRANFGTTIDELFKGNIQAINYSDDNGQVINYKLSTDCLMNQFYFAGNDSEYNTGIHQIDINNNGNDFNISLKSIFSKEGSEDKSYIQHFYDTWRNRYEINDLISSEDTDYSKNAYVIFLPEFVDIGYGKSIESGNIFVLSEIYARKSRSEFSINSYISFNANEYTLINEVEGIKYSIVNTNPLYSASSSMVAGTYNGLLTYSFLDTKTKNYIYLGSTMILETESATHLLNYIFDSTYTLGMEDKPLTYTENFIYTVKQVELEVAVESVDELFDNRSFAPTVNLISGQVCEGDYLSLTFDVEVKYNEKQVEKHIGIGLAEYVLSGENYSSGIFEVNNAGEYKLTVSGLGDTNYTFAKDKNGNPKSTTGIFNINPVDIPIYIDYKVEDNDNNDLTITKEYQANSNGINPIDTLWKKASDVNAYYSYGTTTCYIVKNYYDTDGMTLLQSNLDFMPSNLIIDTSDEDGNYPKNVKRNETTGEIEGYPISYRIINTEYINYAVAFVYKSGNNFIKFEKDEGYELIIKPKTALLYNFGALNSKIYDGTPASVRGTDSAITITGDYQADRINRNGLIFNFIRPQSEMMIGDYQYIRDVGEIIASKNITDAGQLQVTVSYMDANGNMNYEILFADEDIQYEDSNGVLHPEIGVFNIERGTIVLDLRGESWLGKQYDGFGLTNSENITFTANADNLPLIGNAPSDSLSDIYYKLQLKRFGSSKNISTEIANNAVITNTTFGENQYNVGYYWYDLKGVFLPFGSDTDYVTFEEKDASASDWLSWNYKYAIQENNSTQEYYSCDGIYYIAPRDVYVAVNTTDDENGVLIVEADEENAPTPFSNNYLYKITYNGYTYLPGVTEGEVLEESKYYIDIEKRINENDEMFKYSLYVYDASVSTFTNIKRVVNLNEYYQSVVNAFVFGSSDGLYDNNSPSVNADISALQKANMNFNIVNNSIAFKVRPRNIDMKLFLVDISTQKNEMVYGTQFDNDEGLYFRFEYNKDEYNFVGYDANLNTAADIINNIINGASGGRISLEDDGRVCNGFPLWIGSNINDASKTVVFDGIKYIKIGGASMNKLSANSYDSNNIIIPKYYTTGSGLSSNQAKYTVNVVETYFNITRKEIEVIGVERSYFDKDTDNYTLKVKADGMTEEEANIVLEIEDGNEHHIKDYINDNTSRASSVGVWNNENRYFVTINSSFFKSNNSNYIVKTTKVDENFVEGNWDGISVNTSSMVYLPLTISKAKITINFSLTDDIFYGNIFDNGEVGYIGLPVLNGDGIYEYYNHASGTLQIESGIITNVNNDETKDTLQREQQKFTTGVNNVLILDLIRDYVALSEVQDELYSVALDAFVEETPIFENYEVVWGVVNYRIIKKPIVISMDTVEDSFLIGENIYQDNRFTAKWSERNDLYYGDGISSSDTRDRRLAYTVAISQFSLNGELFNDLPSQIAKVLGAEYNPDDNVNMFVYNGISYKDVFSFMSAVCDYQIYTYNSGDSLAEYGGVLSYIGLYGLKSNNFELKCKRTEIMLYPEMIGLGRYTSDYDDNEYVNLIPDTEAPNTGVIINTEKNTITGLSILVRMNYIGFSNNKAIQYIDTKRSDLSDISAYSGMDYDRKITLNYFPDMSTVNLDAKGQPSNGDVITIQILIEESFYGGEYVYTLESNYFSVTMKEEGSNQAGYVVTELNKNTAQLKQSGDGFTSGEGFDAYLSQNSATYELVNNDLSKYSGKYDIINLRAKLLPVNTGSSARKFEIILYDNLFGKLVLGFSPEKNYVRMNYKKYLIQAINNYPNKSGTMPIDINTTYYTIIRQSVTVGSSIQSDTYYEKVGNGFILTDDTEFIGGKDYYIKTVAEGLGSDISAVAANLYVSYSENIISNNLISLFDGANHSFNIYIDKVGAFTNVLRRQNSNTTNLYSTNGIDIIGKAYTTTTTVNADRLFTLRLCVDNSTYFFSYIGEPYVYKLVEKTMDYDDDTNDTHTKEVTTYIAQFFSESGRTGIVVDSLKAMISKYTVQNRLISTATNERYISNVVFWPTGTEENDIPYVTNEGTAQFIGDLLGNIGNITISGGEDAMEAYNVPFNEDKFILSVSEQTVDITNSTSSIGFNPGLYTVTYSSKYNYYGQNQQELEYDLSVKKVRILITSDDVKQITLFDNDNPQSLGQTITPSSPIELANGNFFTNDMQVDMLNSNSLTYVFDSVSFTNDIANLWFYFKLTNKAFLNLKSQNADIENDASGVALNVYHKDGITNAKVIISRQIPNESGTGFTCWEGDEKVINFASDSSVINILKIDVSKVSRDLPTGDVIATDDDGIRLWDDTVVSFRLYQHTNSNTSLVFEDYIREGFGYSYGVEIQNSAISRDEIENVVFIPGTKHYSGLGLDNASIRILDMYVGMPVVTDADFVMYDYLSEQIQGNYFGNDMTITSEEGGERKIYMATDSYDVPLSYKGNTVNIRFKSTGTQGGFRYYFGLNTPYVIQTFGQTRRQRGLMLDYNSNTGKLAFFFFKYNTLYREQIILTESDGVFFNDGEEHSITVFLDMSEVVDRGTTSTSVPKDNYIARIFIDDRSEKNVYVPVGNNLSGILNNNYSQENDDEANKDWLFLKDIYYMGFECYDGTNLQIFDCIAFEQTNLF